MHFSGFSALLASAYAPAPLPRRERDQPSKIELPDGIQPKALEGLTDLIKTDPNFKDFPRQGPWRSDPPEKFKDDKARNTYWSKGWTLNIGKDGVSAQKINEQSGKYGTDWAVWNDGQVEKFGPD